MSVYSERVRKALYAKLNVSGVLASGTGKATGVYEGKAPKTAVLPYLVFQQQAASPVLYNFGQGIADETSFWVIQGFAEETTGVATASPQAIAEQIAQNALTAIGTTLTLTGGGTASYVSRVNDTPSIEGQQGDRYIYQRGFLLRVSVEP
jgi:hypothetical protein